MYRGVGKGMRTSVGDELVRSKACMVHNLLHQLHSWLQLYCRLCLLQRSMQPHTHPHTLCYPHPTPRVSCTRTPPTMLRCPAA